MPAGRRLPVSGHQELATDHWPPATALMRICHVTPHLPPDQAANALLPYHLGRWALARGDQPSYVAHPPRSAGSGDRVAPSGARYPGPVTWLAARDRARPLSRLLRLGSVQAAARIIRDARPVLAAADLVHLHSSGLLTEICALIAARLGKPTVLTLYGTEIWHYGRMRSRPDLFTRAYRRASAVTFYSRRLLDRAVEFGLDRPGLHVIYPPVADEFQHRDAAGQAAERAALGVAARHLIVNVKRLHPLAGQRYVIEALPEVLRSHPDTVLAVCGTGELRPELEAAARASGVDRHVVFTGLVDNAMVARYDMAADVFALPSLLEACPTVALEALACGTPVVSSDNPGGVELSEVFGGDVAVVPKENVPALAEAIACALGSRRRVTDATRALIERDFRPEAVDRQYSSVYAHVLSEARRPTREPL